MNNFKSKSILAMTAGLLGSQGPFKPSSAAGLTYHKETRTSKNTRRNEKTPAKFTFLYRYAPGFGLFLNSKTNKPEVKKIRSDGLSRCALRHFGLIKDQL